MRFTIRRMMIGVLFAGVSLAAARVHPSLGCFTAAVSCLVLIRTFEILDRSGPMRPRKALVVFLESVVVASTILLGTLMPGFCLLAMLDPPPGGIGPSTLVGLALAGLLALAIAPLLRGRL